MVDIIVNVSGDHWFNPHEVLEQIRSTPVDVKIQLNLRAEGPSLNALGVVQKVSDTCKEVGRSLDSITIINCPNVTEITPFINDNVFRRDYRSHFFDMCRDYWVKDVPPTDKDARLLAFFVGRKTISRGWMFYQLATEFNSYCLLSNMSSVTGPSWKNLNRGIPLENFDHWIPSAQKKDFLQWWENCPIDSLDGCTVRDQYQGNINTNSSILNFYTKFHIELVGETYTLGDTFFPTEKTIRPIMAMKPIIVYGPKRFLSRLKDMGFRTWDGCWDESYDQYEGVDRWNAIKKLIESLLRSRDLEQILSRAGEISMHNRLNLLKIVNR